MNLIKNAVVFSAELPANELLAQHLEELLFKPVGETFVSSAGFIPNLATAELLTPIEGGCSLTVRYDEKILPKASVKAAVKAAQEASAEELERELTEDEAGAISERVTCDLIKTALIKTTIVNAFYHSEKKFLIVATTSKQLAQTVISLLIKACGAVRTQTIHVSDIKGGLTTRLTNYLDGKEGAFDGFKLGESCVLKEKASKASFDMENLDAARQGLIEGLSSGMRVERMELVHQSVAFKLTNDFSLRGIEFLGELTEAELEQRDGWDGAYLWRMEAAIQLLQLVATIEALCLLFNYQAPKELPMVEAPTTDAVEQGDDELLNEAVAFVRSTKRASISAVQRQFKIGYNRAARLIEALELAGVVTPMNSNGAREVIGAE